MRVRVKRWRKSRYSKANGNCARVGHAGQMIAIGGTKDQAAVLLVPPGAFRAFLGRIWDGSIL